MTRSRALRLTLMFEGGLLVGALALALLLGVSVADQVRVSVTVIVTAIVATLPVAVLPWLVPRVSWRPLRSLARTARAVARILFRRCRTGDLILVALLAGLGEELFFRGVVQTWLASRLPDALAVAIASLVFGLVHPLSVTYVVLAAIMGAYLGALLLVTGNVLVPVLVHALYDFLALHYLLRRPSAAQADPGGRA